MMIRKKGLGVTAVAVAAGWCWRRVVVVVVLRIMSRRRRLLLVRRLRVVVRWLIRRITRSR